MIHRIDIPSRNPAREAASIVVGMLRQCGADPMKVGHTRMGVALCQAWTRGEMDAATFRRSIANLLILNPSLRMQ